MPLKKRVGKLEKRRRSATPPAGCPGCGWYEGKPMKFACRTRDPGEPDTPQPSDFCATCGRQYVFRIRFDRCG